MDKNEEEQERGDVIKTMVWIVPPIYVVFRLATGGPEVVAFFIAVLSVVAFAYWWLLQPADA